MVYLILADIGGTNSRFKLYNINTNSYMVERTYLTNNFNSLKKLLIEFNNNFIIDSKEIKVYLAIAGDHYNNKIDYFTNINWKGIDGNKIRTKFNYQYLEILNDFEAVGYSIDLINKKNIMKLNKININHNYNCNKLIIGLGTGLGVCLISSLDNKSIVIPTESGNLIFAPLNNEDIELIDFYYYINNKENNTKKTLDIESIISGNGLPFLYKFICKKLSIKPKFVNCEEIFNNHNLTECKITIKYFIRYLSYAIYNLILIYLPRNGIYFVNIVIENLIKKVYRFNYSKFYSDIKIHLNTFKNYNFQNIIENIQFYFINEKNWGNIGILNYALQNL